MKSRGTLGGNGPELEVSSYIAFLCVPEKNDELEIWKNNKTNYPT